MRLNPSVSLINVLTNSGLTCNLSLHLRQFAKICLELEYNGFYEPEGAFVFVLEKCTIFS